MTGLQGGQIGALLVGDEALKAVPVDVGERQLRSRVRALAADDQSRALGPRVERDTAGQLGDPRALAQLAVAVDRGPPRRFGQREDRFAHVLVDRVAEREPHARLAARRGERVAGAGGVRAREDRPLQRLGRELLERGLEHLEVIGGVVGAGVAGSQDTGQHLAAARGQQRVKPEPALVVPGRVLLVRMRGDRRRIEVEDHFLGSRARRPGPRSRLGARRAQALKLCLTDRQKHPPCGRDRRDVPEQRRLRAERDQVRHAPPAVGQHHRQIAEHPAGIVNRAPLAGLGQRPPERVAQTESLGGQRQQRGARSR
jgi:hypothetical protein